MKERYGKVCTGEEEEIRNCLVCSMSACAHFHPQGPVKFDVNGTRVQEFAYVFQYRIDPTVVNQLNRAIIGRQNFLNNQDFIYQNGENANTTWDG